MGNEIAEKILHQEEKGKELANDFDKTRLQSTTVKFHKEITKNECQSFKNAKAKCLMRNKSGVQATVEVNRNIRALNSFSIKTGVAVDYQKALKYPLNPCPLSICHADGMKRSNKKSDLKEILLETVHDLSLQEIKSIRKDAVVVDMMGLVNLITSILNTYEDVCGKASKRLQKT